MLLKIKKYQVCLLLLFFSILGVELVSANEQAELLKVTVKCVPPAPGVYSLGWGTSRLTVPESGKPFVTFRMMTEPVDGKLCQSSDNTGLIVFDKDGEIWSYISDINSP